MNETPSIEQAAEVLRAGGLVAFPTETVYGLGADAENESAARRIFAAKGRPATHPLIVHLGADADLDRWSAGVDERARRLAEAFWPGPLTIILPRSPRIPLAVTGGLETVGVRIPNHPVALGLLRAFGGAIAAPSANRFGGVSPTTAAHVRDDLGTRVDLVLDGGPCDVGIESTIVDLSGDEPEILRPGGVTREDLARVLGRDVAVRTGTSGREVRAPGQMASHYAPRARVVLAGPGELAETVQSFRREGMRVGVIATAETNSLDADVEVLSADGADLARLLYGALREFDRRGCDVIVASLPAEAGLGLALADRLRRAAGPRRPPLRESA